MTAKAPTNPTVTFIAIRINPPVTMTKAVEYTVDHSGMFIVSSIIAD
ncbi:hypothetical protein [Shewanella goraebulensis]|nr:hypothetical protein [Shewanella goraebulensis]